MEYVKSPTEFFLSGIFMENTALSLSIPTFPLDRPVICKWCKFFIRYLYCYQFCACAHIFYKQVQVLAQYR